MIKQLLTIYYRIMYQNDASSKRADAIYNLITK